MSTDYNDADMGNVIYDVGLSHKTTHTRQIVHDSVETIQFNLTNKQRAKVVTRLRKALTDYEVQALGAYPVREHIYHLYNSKVKDELAVSALSRDFNMGVHGHNHEIGKRIARLLSEACEADNKGNRLEAFKLLIDIRVRYNILLSKEVVSILTTLGYDLTLMHDVIDCRKMLFASVAKMVSDLALKRHRSLSGDVIEEVDLIQEALLHTKLGIDSYQPDYTSNEDAGKSFTSFIYRWVYGMLSKFINDNTRNVRVPRSAIDRSRPVYYAIEKLGNVSYDKLADEATRILADIRLKNARRKLIQNERYSAAEVYDILTHTQEEASMDAVISTDEFGHENTFGELIPAPAPLVEVLMDTKHSQSKLITVLHDYCDTDEEREVLTVRWGGEKYRGLKTTADFYRDNTRRSMNKTKVAEIENKIFERIRTAIGHGIETRVNEVAEVLSR